MELPAVEYKEPLLHRIENPQNGDKLKKTERAALRQFLILKALHLNVRQCGRMTGFIGYLAGGICTQERADKGAVAWVAYSIISSPGKLVGLVTSPLRMAYLCKTRTLLYTSLQIESVQTTLQDLIDHGSPENCKAFRDKIDRVIRTYNKTRTKSKSNSSTALIRLAQSAMSEKELAEEMRYYLGEEEAPISIPCGKGPKFLKNQGKRLFNLLMGEFSASVL